MFRPSWRPLPGCITKVDKLIQYGSMNHYMSRSRAPLHILNLQIRINNICETMVVFMTVFSHSLQTCDLHNGDVAHQKKIKDIA